MEKKHILYIGLDPALLDPSSMPGVDPAAIASGITAVVRRLEEHGYGVTWCPVDRGETAEVTVAAELGRLPYAGVVIGAGIRVNPPLFLLFEKLINVVHRSAPSARICFNTTPADTLEAVQRWL